MAKLVTLLFTLVGADDELQIVPVQEVFSDVGAPVAAPAPHLVGHAAVQGHGVAPQQVQDLGGREGDFFYLKSADLWLTILFLVL